MSEKERNIGKKIADAFENLPDTGKEYLIGFAEGVAAKTSDEERSRKCQQPSESL